MAVWLRQKPDVWGLDCDDHTPDLKFRNQFSGKDYEDLPDSLMDTDAARGKHTKNTWLFEWGA